MTIDYLREIRRYNVRHTAPDPARSALLVIDMQQFFAGIAGPILPNVTAVIDACRGAGIPVIFTRHGHRDIEADGGMLVSWWGDNIRYGTPDWELLPEMVPRSDERVLDKDRYSVFRRTDLETDLRSAGIGELIIVGVLTNCCCETTARDGFVRDFRIFFVADGTATVNDDLQIASLKTLSYGFAHVVSTDALCAFLAEVAEGGGTTDG